MIRCARVIVGLLLVLTACGGAGEKAASTFTSPDGGLSVTIPSGVETPDVQIRALDAANIPAELKRFNLRGTLYEMEPDGTTFSKPVTVTRRIDTAAAGLDLSKGIPLFLLASRNAAGTWGLLGDIRVRAEGSGLLVSGTTTHFSTVLAFGGSIRVRMGPNSFEQGVVGRLSVTPRAGVDKALDFHVDVTNVSEPRDLLSVIGLDEEELPNRHGSDYDPAAPKVMSGLILCEKKGIGVLNTTVEITELVPRAMGVEAELFFDARRAEATVTLTTQAKCSGPAASPSPSPSPSPSESESPKPPSIATGCAQTTHDPYGGHPSYLRWLWQIRGAPARSLVSLTARGANGGKAVTARTNASGVVNMKTGIDSYGNHDVIRFTVTDGDETNDLTKEAKKEVGTVNVTAREGTIAGRCP